MKFAKPPMKDLRVLFERSMANLFMRIFFALFVGLSCSHDAIGMSTANEQVLVRLIVTLPQNGEDLADSETVYIAGNLDVLGGWRPDGLLLVRKDDGKYLAEFRAASGAIVEFKVTKGQWATVEKDRWGGEIANRRFTVERAEDDRNEHVIEVVVERWAGQETKPTTVVGKLELHRNQELSQTANNKAIAVWLPPGYGDSSRRYPVIYLQDGQNLFDQRTAAFGQEWRVDETITDLLGQQAIQPAIVVGIWNDSNRIDDYTVDRDVQRQRGGKGEQYLRYIIEHVKPFVDRTYRTSAEREQTFIGGSSLGGLIALHACLEHPDIFGGCLALSPALHWNDDAILHLLERRERSWPAETKLWFSMGAEEGGTPEAQQENLLRARKLAAMLSKDSTAGDNRIEYREIEQGKHNEASWSEQFPYALLMLLNANKADPQVSMQIESPKDYQVFQRSRASRCKVPIQFRTSTVLPKDVSIEWRLIDRGESMTDWHTCHGEISEKTFAGVVETPQGGWWSVGIRVARDGNVLASGFVEHVGVGEIFIVAGQSNSANHGEEKLKPKSDRVVAFDGQGWQLAFDPQPGASGNGGSFLPPFGDAVVASENVPVGFVACGVGATSVREWLPEGTTFPAPPTLLGRVTRLDNGTWASNGEAYRTLIGHISTMGPYGFRAVLWHQGESDANQQDPTRTLPGELYRDYLTKLIQQTRVDAGWQVPWFVAQVSYHTPGDEASPDIRAAQEAMWQLGIALQGPDSDALKGELREQNGQGVHFSGKGLRAHAAAWADKVVPWLKEQRGAQ